MNPLIPYFLRKCGSGENCYGSSIQAAYSRYLRVRGKSPCIVHEDAKIKLAAKRIAWGKFINAGQTCVALTMFTLIIKYVTSSEGIKNNNKRTLWRESI